VASHFVKSITKEISVVINSLFHGEKNPKKRILKNHKKLSQLPTHERMLKNFRLSYFEYCQIWLSILMDDFHLSNVTKLGKK
jgi:hypothetical protein